ncbi:MAG: methyltransferase domain-containing protein [Pseudomonadota bacterium]
MTADKATLDFYNKEAPTYAPWSKPEGPFAWLEKFLSMAPEGRLLDYGCGGGWAAKRMLEEGRKVDAFDGSEGLASEAEALTGLPVACHTFAEFDADAIYAGVWASFCLLHVPKAEMPANLACIHAALAPGGLLYLGLKEGEGEERDSLDRLYVYFREDEIEALLSAAGFTEIDIRIRVDKGYDGVSVNGMHIYAARP